MNKLTTLAVLAIAVWALTTPVAFAATQSTAPITITAQVNSALSISVNLFKNSVSVPNDIPDNAINFGNLNNDLGTGNLRSTTTGSTGTGNVTALISAVSSGVQYTITQTGTQLTSGVNTIPSGATTVVPIYTTADNGGAALVGTMGTNGSWVGTKTLYTSNAAGALRVIQAIYSVTDDPAAGSTAVVPLSQAAGTYTGTVTFTVTA